MSARSKVGNLVDQSARLRLSMYVRLSCSKLVGLMLHASQHHARLAVQRGNKGNLTPTVFATDDVLLAQAS